MSQNSEYHEMVARHRARLAEEARVALLYASHYINRFTNHADSRGIVLGKDSFQYLPAIGIVANAPGLSRQLLGPMPTQRDGLLAFADIAVKFPPSQFHAGYFVGSEYILMADSCFRRGMHPISNWNPRFIEIFWGSDFSGATKYIGIDEDRVRVDVDGPAYFERDTWYGAPFNEDIRRIPSGVVKLRPPLDIGRTFNELFFADAYCLDIKWSEASGIKTFQALEFKTDDVQIDIGGVAYHPARYMHAEFEIAANCFRHFDGAIQLYQETEYRQRRDSDFNMTTKMLDHVKARSRKVFKLNGSLKTQDWVELCCHFLASNPLSFEYFTGAYPSHVEEAVSKVRSGQLNLDDA